MNRALLASAVALAFTASTPIVNAQSAQAVDAARAGAIAAAEAAVGATTSSTEATAAPRAGSDRRAFRNPSERVEARLAYIRTALKITDAQQPQWEGFANVLRKHARDMDQRMSERRAHFQKGAQRPDRQNVTAIERLERTQQRMAQRSARLNEVIAAAKPLYASLSPEQKQVADAMIARQGGRGGHHRGHHRGMHRGV
jgi:hypothetical protein